MMISKVELHDYNLIFNLHNRALNHAKDYNKSKNSKEFIEQLMQEEFGRKKKQE
jgi:hypothetical protein